MNSSSTEKDIVLSSRIRLARNIKGYNFIPSIKQQDREKLETLIYNEIYNNDFFKGFSIYRISDLDEIDRMVLKERKIISQRYYRHGSGLVVTDDRQQTSIITGDLDHLRISAVMDGLNIDCTLEKALEIERELAKSFDFASTSEEGYLTVNISDCGIAMKGSVYLHLPALTESELMDQYIINTIETMLEVTGFSGGGAHSLGGLYIISNKNGYFPDESHLAELLNRTAGLFIEGEKEIREDMLNGKYPAMEDRIFRAYGLLKYCRQISEQEAISALSMVRLGISLKWIENLTIEDISFVLGSIGNGFIRSFAYESNPDETDIMRLRAETIQKTLNLES